MVIFHRLYFIISWAAIILQWYKIPMHPKLGKWKISFISWYWLRLVVFRIHQNRIRPDPNIRQDKAGSRYQKLWTQKMRYWSHSRKGFSQIKILSQQVSRKEANPNAQEISEVEQYMVEPKIPKKEYQLLYWKMFSFPT